jgi:hypothetical protein
MIIKKKIDRNEIENCQDRVEYLLMYSREQ